VAIPILTTDSSIHAGEAAKYSLREMKTHLVSQMWEAIRRYSRNFGCRQVPVWYGSSIAVAQQFEKISRNLNDKKIKISGLKWLESRTVMAIQANVMKSGDAAPTDEVWGGAASPGAGE
jgi:hypothetical protein